MRHKNNLVLGFVGDESVHSNWISCRDKKEFDLALVYYGSSPGRFEEDADFYFAKRGFKYWQLKEMAQLELANVLSKYDRVWLPDDDIDGDTQSINQLFQLCEKHRLKVAQPAIRNGELSYESFRCDSRFEVRYSPYVEVMCPVLRGDALMEALPTFHESISSWGLDWIWSKKCGYREMAIIDAAPMDHTRPIGTGLLYKQLAKKGVTPNDELRSIRHRYGIRNTRERKQLRNGTLRMRGILRNGRVGWNRSLLKSWFESHAA